MLTDKQCRNAKCPPDKKRVRLTDAHGLYLEVSPPSARSPNGSKRWFQKLYVDGNRLMTQIICSPYDGNGVPGLPVHS